MNLEKPDESLIIVKPTDADEHEGGQRYAKGSWQHHVLRRWIAAGAKHERAAATAGPAGGDSAAKIWFQQGARTRAAPGRRRVGRRHARGRDAAVPLPDEQRRRWPTIDEQGLRHGRPSPATPTWSCLYDNGVMPVPVLRPVTDKIGEQLPRGAHADQDRRTGRGQAARSWGSCRPNCARDAEFLRRVSLDLTGTLPTPQEVEQFLADKVAEQAGQKIDELLEYAGLCRLVDHQAVRLHRQQRRTAEQRRRRSRAGRPGMVRLDLPTRGRKRAL